MEDIKKAPFGALAIRSLSDDLRNQHRESLYVELRKKYNEFFLVCVKEKENFFIFLCFFMKLFSLTCIHVWKTVYFFFLEE